MELTVKVEKIIDAHILFGCDFWLSKNKPELDYFVTPDKLSRATLGINNFYGCIMPFPSAEGQSYLKENLLIAEQARANKAYVPVFAFNPKVRENCNQVVQLLNEFPNGKIIIWPILCDLDFNELIDDKTVQSVLEKFCVRKEFAMHIHIGSGKEQEIGRVVKLKAYEAWDIVRFAKKYNKVKFVLTHLLRCSLPALREVKNMDNVVVDTDGVSCQLRWYENGINVFPARDSGYLAEAPSEQIIESLVHGEGLADKLVFGSSYPYSRWWGYDIKDEIALIKNCRISEEERQAILYKNFERFMSLELI